MRRGSVRLDLPCFMALNTPWWLARANFVTWLSAIPLALVGYRWPLLPFMACVAFNFVWGYRAWRAAGRPAIDEPPSLVFRAGLLKSLWPPRDSK